MANLMLDGALLRKMVITGANLMEENKALIDSLNVFPVPDGDTGTNMSLTILSAAREVIKCDSANACDVLKAAASGSLRGARGNSGVILSQLFRGFAKALEGKEAIGCADITAGLLQATATAYKAVMKPKEGTILTVARVLGEKAEELTTGESLRDFDVFAREVLKAGDEILLCTTNMLPQLQEAGVVDAGGKGLLVFLKGCVAGLRAEGDVTIVEKTTKTDGAADFAMLSADDIVFAYCTEFFININEKGELDETEAALVAYLDTQGDSIVVVGDEDIIKVHVHTNNPGLVLEEAMKYGFLSSMKIENMKLQHTGLTTQKPYIAPKEVGIAAVATGAGLVQLFKELGADAVIEGGQTMNPSTQDFLAAIDKINANNIILLPNNKNIILAASQAAKITKNKRVYTVPSKSMPEGFAAMLSFVAITPANRMYEHMKDAINKVKTGEVTYAVRASTIDGRKIKKGDIMGLTDGKITVVAKDVADCAFMLLAGMLNNETEIVTIYYGQDVTQEAADALAARISKTAPNVDIEVQDGGQPLYYYIFSVE